jgi:hypothetical protein
MILLWGVAQEYPLAAVREALLRLGATVAFLDQRAVLETEVELSFDERVGGTLRVGADELALEDVRALYLRPNEWRSLPAVKEAGEGSVEWNHALGVEDAMVSWADTTPALVVNRPHLMAANASKPFQAMQISAHGFRVPDTLLTTDSEAALEFWARHGEIIYKSISGARSIVARLGEEHRERLADLSWCPTQFQEYVPGTDYRVHVVGEEIFPCEIVSAADDYRYAATKGIDTHMRACRLPDDCAARCIALASALQLSFAGIDLRLRPDGQWYCFEVNTTPGFTYFQEVTGQPIDEAVARLLMSA